MAHDTFMGWLDYFEKRPYGWRDDSRAHKIMSAWGVKEQPWKVFPSLKAIYHPEKEVNEDGTDMSSLKGSSLMNTLMKAKGGASIPL